MLRPGVKAMEKDFWSNWARYNGTEYRCVSYGNNKAELFAGDDSLKENVLYTVQADELEDCYTLMTYAILRGIQYVVYEIENDIVTYKKYVNDKEFMKKPKMDFELIYLQKNHTEYVEKKIVFIDEKRIDRAAVNRKFWPEEMASGNIMFSASDDLITIHDLNKILEELYGARITDKGGSPEALLFDEYIAWCNIDGNRFDISSDWGIVTISPKEEKGNKYIIELVDYLNQK